MKSKTRKTSQKTRKIKPNPGPLLAIGYDPPAGLPAASERLLRAVQANFLSMLSHELKTPLMGVLNALTLLEEGGSGNRAGGWSAGELLGMARKSAQSLHSALTTLLDLAALESGNLRLQWKEMVFPSLARAWSSEIPGLRCESLRERARHAPVLGDAAKLRRTFLQIANAVSLIRKKGASFTLSAGERKLILQFTLDSKKEKEWDAFRLALTAAHEGGVFSPASAFSSSFGQLVQEEGGFLANESSALGSELFLSQEVLRLHGASLRIQGKPGKSAKVEIELPLMSPEEGLLQALRARLAQAQIEGGGVSLFLIRFSSPGEVGARARELEACVYRSSDSAYSLGEGRFALLLNDWVPEASPDLLRRVEKRIPSPFRASEVHAPRDGTESTALLAQANRKLKGSTKTPKKASRLRS